ncbi:MAG: Lar family restriction alleviation protein [Sphaerochaetaceae bacterium]
MSMHMTPKQLRELEKSLPKCPFCGSHNLEVRGGQQKYVLCHDCGASANGRTEHYEDAAKAWTRRSVYGLSTGI